MPQSENKRKASTEKIRTALGKQAAKVRKSRKAWPKSF
jgi:hypothetical protein